MRVFLFIAAMVVLVALLVTQFPYAIRDADSKMHLFYLGALVLLIGSGAMVSRQRLSTLAMQGVVWVGIFLVVILAYSYRDSEIGKRILGELAPQKTLIARGGEIIVKAGEGGHFYLEAEVNGTKVKFMVDTGASDIVLAPFDARRAGFAASGLRFTRPYNTANGVGYGAPVTLDRLKIGEVILENLEASVNEADMDVSLLGMTFLNQFKRHEVKENILTLSTN